MVVSKLGGRGEWTSEPLGGGWLLEHTHTHTHTHTHIYVSLKSVLSSSTSIWNDYNFFVLFYVCMYVFIYLFIHLMYLFTSNDED